MTKEEEIRLTREHFRLWREVTGPTLERIKRKELREYDYSDHMASIEGLLELATLHRKSRRSSGMAEFYRRLGATSNDRAI